MKLLQNVKTNHYQEIEVEYSFLWFKWSVKYRKINNKIFKYKHENYYYNVSTNEYFDLIGLFDVTLSSETHSQTDNNQNTMEKNFATLLSESLNNLSDEDIKKYFSTENENDSDEWISIEDKLPMMRASDILKGYTIYTVKDKDGNESISAVTDHNIWYYNAKELGITHWKNNK